MAEPKNHCLTRPVTKVLRGATLPVVEDNRQSSDDETEPLRMWKFFERGASSSPCARVRDDWGSGTIFYQERQNVALRVVRQT